MLQIRMAPHVSGHHADKGFDSALRFIACMQGNYEFGISRIIKSLEPYHSKLSTGTHNCFRCSMSYRAALAIMVATLQYYKPVQLLIKCALIKA
jgi:hypothetical protein